MNFKTQLAELFRALSLNHKFLRDRRSELTKLKSYSLSAILKSFDPQEKGYCLAADIKQFLTSRCVVFSQSEFNCIMREMDIESESRISYSKIAVFLGDQQITSKKDQHLSGNKFPGELESRVICVFEQIISNSRRIEVYRQKLAECDDQGRLFRMIDPQNVGVASAANIVKFVMENCPVDSQMISHIFQILGQGLTFRTFLRMIAPNRHQDEPQLGLNTLSKVRSSPKFKRQLTFSSITPDYEQFEDGDRSMQKSKSFVEKGVGRITKIAQNIHKLDSSFKNNHQWDRTRGNSKQQLYNSTINCISFNNINKSPQIDQAPKLYQPQYSPSLARLRDFQDKIKQMQHNRSNALLINKNRTPIYKQHNRTYIPSTAQKGYLKLQQQEQQLFASCHKKSHPSPLNSPKSNIASTEYIRSGDKIKQLIETKQSEIAAERYLRTRVEQQLRNSREELEYLKQLLIERQNSEISEAVQKSIEKPKRQERLIGKIRYHNLTVKRDEQPAQVSLLQRQRQQTVVNKYHYQRVARRCKLEREFFKNKLERELQKTQLQYR